jgi:putative phosphoribosyl transferase
MVFKDRADAGKQLVILLRKDSQVVKNLDNTVVVSLLRGGIIVGEVVAKSLNVSHLPLAVTKIPAPHNPELAIGALCFEAVFLEEDIVRLLELDAETINNQIETARSKFKSYLQKFGLKEEGYQKSVKDKVVILTDDGVATGSTVRAALLYLRGQKAASVYLAVPVAPADFDPDGFDKVFIVHKDPFFSAVSQFYQNFPQVEDGEVIKLISGVIPEFSPA